jgi:predicted DNA-binding transcriptional regulator YafY
MGLPEREFYSARDLGAAFGVSPRTVVRWIRAAEVPTIPREPRQGSRVRVSFNDLMTFAERHPGRWPP